MTMNVPRLRFREFSNEWCLGKIGDGYELISGQHLSPNEYGSEEHGVGYFTGPSDFTHNEKEITKWTDKTRNTANKGDILITVKGSGVGMIWLLDIFEIAIGRQLMSIRSKVYSPSFLYSFLFKKFHYFKSLASGNMIPGLNRSDILTTKVYFPSIPEQTKIATFLTAIDDKITQLTKKCDLLAKYKKGIMQQIFSQKIRFKDDDGGEFGEWGNRTLGEVTTFLDGKRKPIKESDRAKMKGQYPYYGASGIIDYVNDYIFDKEIILLGEDGENILSRNLPLAFKVSGKCWVNNHAHVIKPDDSTDIDFLAQYLDTISYTKYNTGTAQPKLNQEVCKKIPLHLPTQPEQTKIANFLTAIDDKITHTQAQLKAAKQYKKGLLQQMFV